MRAVTALALLFTSWLLTLNSLKAEVLDKSCFTGQGRNYRGTVATTRSGRTCQTWSVQTPHRHDFTPEDYPCSGLDNNNYCRNPNDEIWDEPWCHTTDPGKESESCDIPDCDGVPEKEPFVRELTCFSCRGENYRGTVATTISRRTCQSWAVQRPHRHSYTPQNYPRAGVHKNYCRNPNGSRKKPWCFTTDSRTAWEYCVHIPRCGVPEPAPMLPKHCGPPEVSRMNSVMIGLSQSVCAGRSVYAPGERVLYDCMVGYTPTGGSHAVTCVDGTWTPLTLICESHCGRLMDPTANVEFVIEGTLSHPGEHPWQVSLQRRSKGTSNPFRHACGGVLIASCWVVTAAHCIKSAMDMHVVVGGVDIANEELVDQVIEVERGFIHKEYRNTKDNTPTNDIALLKLRVTDGAFCANETNYVKYACLPNKIFPDGKECVISGWGKTKDADRPTKLSHGDVSLMSKDRCEEFNRGTLDDSMICAKDRHARVNACSGDSGGPLICKDNGVYYMAGLVSWGNATCSGEVPGVYANVHRFVEWIASCVAHNGSPCKAKHEYECDYDYYG